MGAVTSDGFVHFFDELIEMYELRELYIIKGGSGIGKSSFIKKFTESFKEHPIDYIYCSNDPNSLDGAVITDLNIGIVDGTAPHILEVKYPGLIDEIIDLGKFINKEKLKTKANKEKIDMLLSGKKENYAKAFSHLAKAREYHAELEMLYSGCVEFDKVDELLGQILKNHTSHSCE